MGNRVAVINHGLSNLSSIVRALERCGGDVTVTADPTDLKTVDRIVLPGVGAFPRAMASLNRSGMATALCEEAARRPVPILGICLGMQLMAMESNEGEHAAGLGLIAGSVDRLQLTAEEERIPHMGWNAVNVERDTPLFDGIVQGTDFYFVHSYHLRCPPEQVIARTPYCGGFVSAACNGQVMAVQFHPEKSLAAGFRVLSNFVGL